MEKKKNNQWLSLAFNILLPVIILTRLSDDAYLGSLWALLVALAFPLGYGLYEWLVEKQKSFISVVGFVGVLLTGIIGVFEFPPQWIAIKEAAVPLSIGIVVLASTKTKWQLIRKMLYNPELMNVELIESRLTDKTLQIRLDKLLNRANVMLSLSFLISAILNYILAKVIVTSPAGTSQFNEELGRMTMLSFPVIALPSTLILLLIFWLMFKRLKEITGLGTNDLLAAQLNK